MLFVVGSSLFQLPISHKEPAGFIALRTTWCHVSVGRPFSVESAICRVAIHHSATSISVWHDDEHDTSFDKWDNGMIHDWLYKISALRPIFFIGFQCVTVVILLLPNALSAEFGIATLMLSVRLSVL